MNNKDKLKAFLKLWEEFFEEIERDDGEDQDESPPNIGSEGSYPPGPSEK